MLLLAKKHNHLKAINYLNKDANCWHVEIKGKTIVMTVHAVQSPFQKVRRADYRDTLAEGNQLWYPPVADIRPRGEYCYAMLLHGPHFENPARVSFVHLTIPSFDSSSYLLNINLEKHCNLELYSNIKEEMIEDREFVSLRRKSIIEKAQ
jgi:hypothetical protein